jgi:hypothetical protein
MLGAIESAKYKQGELDTRQGNQEAASSEYHIERGFGPVNDGKINISFSVKVGEGFSYIERLLGGPTGEVIHVAYRFLNDVIGLGIIRFLWEIQHFFHVLQKKSSYPKAMELIAAYSKQGCPYVVEATQPYLISSISDGHRNDVPAKRALRITR